MPSPLRLADRLVKLRAMRAQEVAERVRYRLFLAAERRTVERGGGTPGLRRMLSPALNRRSDWQEALLARRASTPAVFFAGLRDAAETRQAFVDRFPAEHARSREQAASARRHVIEFFGQTFDYGERIDWHMDPPSGRRWPAKFHATIPTAGDVGYGDIKFVWEVNRHQFFVDLAKHAFVDDDRESAAELHRLLRDWMAENPYGIGVNWSCALEPAFRVYSWLWSYYFCLAAGFLDDRTHLLWLTGFAEHGRFLHRHLEVFSSPYNHLAGEAAALYMLGVLFPEFAESRRWRARGRSILERTLREQFHDDGASVEQSTFYHHATLAFYLMAALIGRNNGEEFSPDVWQAIERGLEFSMSIAWPDGGVPAIGGGDDGKPIRLEHVPLWDFRPLLAAGAAILGRADFRHAATRFWEDALWLTGVAGLRAFDALRAASPAQLSIVLPSSGYAVLRTAWDRTADFVCVDCGPQAAGLRHDAIPSAAHGHADCLSLIAALGGRRVLVDPGFFCYNGDPEWEVHFRRSAAHNTVVVDGRDQATHVAKMAWSETYNAAIDGFSTKDAAVGWIQAHHDGYTRLPGGVVHKRSVWLRPDGYVLIYDEITSSGAHRATASFQFAPGELETFAASALYDGRFELAWACTDRASAAPARGGTSPDAGWIATSLGVRAPAPRLKIEFAFAGGRAALLTVLADRERGASASRLRVATGRHGGPGQALTATIEGPAWRDHVYATDGTTARVGSCSTDATLAVVRTTDGCAASGCWRIGGTAVDWTPSDHAEPNVRATRRLESLLVDRCL